MSTAVGAESTAARSAKRRSDALRYVVSHVWLYAMLLPIFVYYVVFKYFPMYGVVIAFKDFNLFDGIWDSPWVGLQWFRIMFADPNFFNILGNSLYFSFVQIVVGFPFPIIFALLLNELTFKKYKKLVQTVTYLPHFFSWIICGGLIIQLLAYRGPVNNLLRFLGQDPLYFLSRFETFFPVYILSTDIIRSSTDVFSTYVYRVGIRGGAYSYTAAIGLWRSAVELVLILGANKLAKLAGESGLW